MNNFRKWLLVITGMIIYIAAIKDMIGATIVLLLITDAQAVYYVAKWEWNLIYVGYLSIFFLPWVIDQFRKKPNIDEREAA